MLSLPKTNSSPLKRRFLTRKGLSSNSPFSGCELLVSGRVTTPKDPGMS